MWRPECLQRVCDGQGVYMRGFVVARVPRRVVARMFWGCGVGVVVMMSREVSPASGSNERENLGWKHRGPQQPKLCNRPSSPFLLLQ
jgi:hypothetical protein